MVTEYSLVCLHLIDLQLGCMAYLADSSQAFTSLFLVVCQFASYPPTPLKVMDLGASESVGDEQEITVYVSANPSFHADTRALTGILGMFSEYPRAA